MQILLFMSDSIVWGRRLRDVRIRLLAGALQRWTGGAAASVRQRTEASPAGAGTPA